MPSLAATLRASVGAAITCLALLGSAPAAHALTPPTVEYGKATVLAGGAGISIPVTVTCGGGGPTDSSYGDLDVRQRVSKSAIATGGAFFNVRCDAAAHTYRVVALASPEAAPFKSGPALITGGLTYCEGDEGCNRFPNGPAQLDVGAKRAVAPTPTPGLSIGKPVLFAKGVAVELPVTAQCAPTTALGQVGLTVYQVVGGSSFASGHLERQVTCDGAPHTTRFVVQAEQWYEGLSPVFKPGSAIVLGDFIQCAGADYVGCTTTPIVGYETRIGSR